MLGYIFLSLYGIYCCVFCTAIIYTECRERHEENLQRRQQIRQQRRQQRRQYEEVMADEPRLRIEMILESEYSNRFNNESTLTPIMEEDEIEKVFDMQYNLILSYYIWDGEQI